MPESWEQAPVPVSVHSLQWYSLAWRFVYSLYGLTTLNKPKSREVSTNDGIITQNIFNAAVPTSIETK